ncbi:hypothetical protein KC622_02580, partial [Candidatus Dojkabacteria bacterium]|nr:hypothetical protein [Candidatus Dojkabacteria bacterium]
SKACAISVQEWQYPNTFLLYNQSSQKFLVELADLNSIFETTYKTKDELLTDMKKSSKKTDYAIKIFDTDKSITIPQYINDAV